MPGHREQARWDGAQGAASPERTAGPGSRPGSVGTGGEAGERPSLPASGHRRPLPRQRSPFRIRADGRGGNSFADSLRSPTVRLPRQKLTASPPVGEKGYLDSKKPAAVSSAPILPPPCPWSGGQQRAASPHKLISAPPCSRPRSAQPPAQPRLRGAAGIVCGRAAGCRGRAGLCPGTSWAVPGDELSCAQQGWRLRDGEEGEASGTRCDALRNERLFNFHHSFPLPGCSREQGACCVSARFPSPNLNS